MPHDPLSRFAKANVQNPKIPKDSLYEFLRELLMSSKFLGDFLCGLLTEYSPRTSPDRMQEVLGCRNGGGGGGEGIAAS